MIRLRTVRCSFIALATIATAAILGGNASSLKAAVGWEQPEACPAKGTSFLQPQAVIGYAVADEEVANRWRLHWTAQLQGDFNLDGAVNIADITKLAQNFGKEVSNDLYLKDVLDRFQPFGTIGIEDVTSIAWFFDARITGFRIEVKTDLYAEPSAVYNVDIGERMMPFSTMAYEITIDTTSEDTYVVIAAEANEVAERLFYVQDEVHLIL